MISAITVFISAISKPLLSWITARSEIKAAEHRQKIAAIERKAELLSDKESYNNTWELSALEKSSNALRWWFVILYSVPVAITLVLPDYGVKMWHSLEAVPSWVIGVILSMTGFSFGSAPAKHIGASLMALVVKDRESIDKRKWDTDKLPNGHPLNE